MHEDYASILVVDDEPLNQSLFSTILGKAGYLTHSVDNGEKAVELLNLEKYDLILLDINMPGLNGIDILKMVKHEKRTKDIPIVMLTSEHDDETILQCFKLGANDYIKKPIEPSLLRARIWRCLQKNKSHHQKQIYFDEKGQKLSATILVVDDDSLHRATIVNRLSADNYTILGASSGLEAISTLQNEKIDLIILDVSMPGINGFDILKQIKSSEELRHIPILMCSANDDTESIQVCLKSGANDYIVKPYNATLLKARVQSLLVLDEMGNIKSSSQPNTSDILLDVTQRIKHDKIELPAIPTSIGVFCRESQGSNNHGAHSHLESLMEDDNLIMRLCTHAKYDFYSPMSNNPNPQAIFDYYLSQEKIGELFALGLLDLFHSQQYPFKKILYKLWHHSLATAESARIIGNLLQFHDSNLLFNLGMLHDIGMVPILNTLETICTNNRFMDETNIMEIAEPLHTIFGAKMMAKWDLSEEYCFIAEQHHTFAEGGKYTQAFLIVCLANLLTRIPGYSYKSYGGEDYALSYPARTLGIQTNQIDKIVSGMIIFIDKFRYIA